MTSTVSRRVQADLCIIGAGSGGLSVAYGASQLGRRVVLIEEGRMGGDCLNYGCVPSKALLAAARAAQRGREAARYGVTFGEPEIDYAAVRRHVRDAIATIAPVDSVERYEGLGVEVLKARARFTGPRSLVAGETEVRADQFVIAAGSSPALPPIEGLTDGPYLTNETLWDLEARPDALIVVGGGPIGIEMAQAYRRLGAAVTVVEDGAILPRDDSELAAVVRDRLIAEGVRIEENARVARVSRTGGEITAHAERDGRTFAVTGSHLLVAVGRRANTEGLHLEAAGVETHEQGIKVDRHMRTTNRRIWAVGDVTGGMQFTHVAGYQAGLVVRNALFKVAKAEDESAAKAPHVTYTDPELAGIGLTEEAARAAGHEVTVTCFAYDENDRAIAEDATRGHAKVVVGKRGEILGVSIVGEGAGDLIGPWALALSEGLKLSAFTGMIAPYPTLTEISKRAASAYYAPKLFADRTRRLVSILSRLPF